MKTYTKGMSQKRSLAVLMPLLMSACFSVPVMANPTCKGAPVICSDMYAGECTGYETSEAGDYLCVWNGHTCVMESEKCVN